MPRLASTCCALLLLCGAATASAAKDLDLGEIRSPHAALQGKKFKLRLGDRLRFTNYQAMPNGGAALYFGDISYTPKSMIGYSVQVIGSPAHPKPTDRVAKHIFTVRKTAKAGTTVKIRTSHQTSADWRAAFAIEILR